MAKTLPARRIEYRPLGGLAPDPRNPKAHDTELITSSVGRFGYIEPVVLDGRTDYILSGHGRTEALRAAQARGEEPPAGVEVIDGEWQVPVVVGWSSKDDAEAGAALIALNRTTEAGGWHDEALLPLLEALDELGQDAFVGVGFGLTDLDDLRARLEELEPPPAGEDDFAGYPGEDLPAVTDHGDGTGSSPSLREYAEKYGTQGKRLIVLEYQVAEYALVNEGLGQLRRDLGVETNTAAVRELLSERYPQIAAAAAQLADD